jgi:hypothetical protein
VIGKENAGTRCGGAPVDRAALTALGGGDERAASEPAAPRRVARKRGHR